MPTKPTDGRELLLTQYAPILKRFHAEKMADPIYRAGFQSEDNRNPHPFDAQLDLARMRIAAKEGALTEEERAQLAKLNAEMDATPWARWSSGHHSRSYPFLLNPA